MLNTRLRSIVRYTRRCERALESLNRAYLECKNTEQLNILDERIKKLSFCIGYGYGACRATTDESGGENAMSQLQIDLNLSEIR